MIFTSALRSVDATVSSDIFPDEKVGVEITTGTGIGAEVGKIVGAVFSGLIFATFSTGFVAFSGIGILSVEVAVVVALS